MVCSASADAQAVIFGEAIASAVSRATGPGSSTLSAVNAQEQSAAIARASASVSLVLETDGGLAEGVAEAVATAVAQAIVTALGEAIAYSVRGGAGFIQTELN